MDSEEQPRKLRLDVKECARSAAEKINSECCETSWNAKGDPFGWIDQNEATKIIAAEFADIDMDRELSSGCIHDIGETLKRLECCHGPGDAEHAGTPPMMYSDWIRCIVVHERRKAKAIQDELDALKAKVAERERNGL